LLYFVTMLAFYWLLEGLFGNRPIILAMLIGAGLCGVLATSLEWWTASLNSLPAVLFDILALSGLLRYSMVGKRGYLWLSIVAFALGIQFYEASSTFGAVLFVFDLLFLSSGTTWSSRLVSTLRPWWKWVAFAAPVIFDFGWRAFHGSEYALPPTQGPSVIVRFIAIGWAQGFSPMIFGIDYPTLSFGWDRGAALIVPQVVIALVVIFTCVRRRLAWRAWVMFFSGFAALELVAAVGRAYYGGGSEYAINPVYWTLQPFILVLAIGLACLPNSVDLMRGRTSPKRVHARSNSFYARSRELSLLTRCVVAIVLLAVAVVGINEMWSSPSRAQGALNRSYVANTSASWSLAQTKYANPFVWDTQVPAFVQAPVFTPYDRVATTVGLLIPLRIDAPAGQGLILSDTGTLVRATRRVVSRAVINGGSESASQCFPPKARARYAGFPLTATVPAGYWFVRIRYQDSSGFESLVNLFQVEFPKGSGEIVVPMVLGRTTALNIALQPGQSICVAGEDIETPAPVAGHP
jgi:hypothetical protein